MVESGQSSASSPVPRAASASQLQRRGVAARDERTRPDGQSEPAHQDLAGTGSLPQPAIDERLLLAIYNARSAAERGEESLAEAARAAGRDALTGLPTRTIRMDRLLQAMAHRRRCRKRAAVLLLDLDQFKRVNTRLGHAAGDTVLRHLAAGLAGAVRAEDTVSRHGGDEFLVLLPEIDGLAEAELIAATLLTAA